MSMHAVQELLLLSRVWSLPRSIRDYGLDDIPVIIF